MFDGGSFSERVIIFFLGYLGQNPLAIALMRLKKCTAKLLNQI